MLFSLDHDLLTEVRAALSEHKRNYWILGGAGSGKSTVCRALAEQLPIIVYDMDAYVFGDFMSRFTGERHPASTAWFSASDPMNWALSLSWTEFNSMYQAASAEYISLFAEDISKGTINEPVIVDGGITHPSVLAEVVPVKRIICLMTAPGLLENVWESSEERLAMKRYVLALENGLSKWNTFQEFDARLTQTALEESELFGIKVISRDEGASASHTASKAAEYFGL